MSNWIESHPHPTWDQVRQGSMQSHYRQRLWEKISKVADAPILKPDPRATAQVTVLGTGREKDARNHGLEVTYEMLEADASNAVQLPGARLQLRGIAMAWPTALDEPLPVPTVYHDASDGRPLVLDGLPKELREMTPDLACYLHLRLLFELEGDFPFEEMEVLVFDARTHASVAARFELDWSGAGVAIRLNGRFMALDLEAAVWHDTPLDVMVDLPAGAEQRHPFPALGQMVSFLGDKERRIELTRLGTGKGDARLLDFNDFGASGEVTFTWQVAEPNPFPFTGFGEPPPRDRQTSLWDLGDLLESDYLRVRAKGDGDKWRNYRMGNLDRGMEAEGAELIFRPGRQRCWFKVAGLPGAPNPRNVRDLLDIRIPGPIERAEYGWIAETLQLDYDHQFSNPSDTRLDTPRKDVTLRELLKLHADEEGDIVTVDRENLRLLAETRMRDWRDDLGDWWRARFP